MSEHNIFLYVSKEIPCGFKIYLRVLLTLSLQLSENRQDNVVEFV